MEKLLKNSIVRDYENNILKNEAGIHLAVIVIHLFQNFIFKMPFKIFLKFSHSNFTTYVHIITVAMDMMYFNVSA